MSKSESVKSSWDNDPERRSKMRARMRAQWADPEYVARVKANRKFVEPERAAKQSKSMKSLWAKPKQRAKFEAAKRKAAPQIAATVTELWKDPEYRAHQSAERKKRCGPEEKARLTAMMQAVWDDPEKRAALIERRKAGYADPERRRKTSEALKGRVAWNKGLTKDTHPSLKRMSEQNAGQVPEYGKMRAWYIEGNRRIWMRSKWEVAFAQYLDRRGLEWQYESRMFKVGKGDWIGTTYTPDFYLVKSDQYIEIKGRLNGNSKSKYDAFRTRYTEIKWRMFDGAKLKSLGVIDIYGRAILK